MPQRFSWARNNIQPPLIFGLSAASTLRWRRERLSSQVTQKLIRSSRFSKSRAPLTRPYGRRLSSYPISRPLSPSGREFRCRSTPKTWMSTASISSPAWSLSSPINVSPAAWPCSTLTSTISTRASSRRTSDGRRQQQGSSLLFESFTRLN